MKMRTNVTIDAELHDAARDLNINISATLNRALAEEIRRHLMVKSMLEDKNSALYTALREASATG